MKKGIKKRERMNIERQGGHLGEKVKKRKRKVEER